MKLNKKNTVTASPSHAAKVDPLYVIFEQHLYSIPDAELERDVFIRQIVNDYLTLLRKKELSIPKALEPVIVEELSNQVNTMLVKKIYGCLSIEEHREKTPVKKKRKARSKYTKLVR